MADLAENETPQSSLAARRALEESLAVDAQSAEAWSALALVLVRDYVRNWNGATRKDLEDAEAAVNKGLALDQSNAIAYLARGEILRVKGDDQGSLEAFDRALRSNPNLALAAAQKANQLVFLGRAKEAPAQIKKAIAISPNDPALGIFYWIMGRAYFALKDYDTAIGWLRKSIDLQPTVWFNRAHLISAYALTGRLNEPEAQAALAEYRQKFQNWPLHAIEEWFHKAQPNPRPGFKENLAELYKGLEAAGI
jgi:tetratricopeptide (TPR) repeat protein